MLSNFNKIKIGLGIFSGLGIFIFLILFFFYLPVGGSEIEKFFLIEKGKGIKEIVNSLKKEKLIKSEFAFIVYGVLSGKHKKLQAGCYFLSPSMNIPQIVEKFFLGDVKKERITIIEGWNLKDIGFYFENQGLGGKEELWRSFTGYPSIDYLRTKEILPLKDFSQDFSFLKDKPKNISLEGYLFPDTYEIHRECKNDLEKIIRKILKNFNQKLNPQLKEIKRQNKTIFEIVTMASLIEKEVRTFEDKKLVSGILWKRLKNNIPLQVDATITYITGKKTTKISIEETKIDSFYNTYKYSGLPLGPICNPGLESILAAIYPQESPYWYYLSTPEGETIFNETLEKHNLAKEKYLR